MFLLLSATLVAQDAPFFGPPPNKEAPAPNVTPERLRDASKEPQNWLTYSGGYREPAPQPADDDSPDAMPGTSS